MATAVEHEGLCSGKDLSVIGESSEEVNESEIKAGLVRGEF